MTKFWMGISFLVFCWLAGESSAQAQPETWYDVGVAKVDITPNYRVRLNGFGSRRDEADGKSQTLWAKALAISQPQGAPVVILTIDNLGVRWPMVEAVAQALADRHQLPRENLVVTFTHTHCAPKVAGASDTIFSTPIPVEHQVHIERYTSELQELLIRVADEALQRRQPATLEWQVGRVTFAANRRTPGGPVDHDLPVLIARDRQRKPLAIYTTYACHCVTLSFNFYSGDWAGYAQEKIEEAFPGAVALVSIGCGSDANPVSGVVNDRVAVAQDQGEQIAREVQRLEAEPGRPLSGNPVGHLALVPLPLKPLPTPTELETLRAAGGAAGYNAAWQLAKLARGEPLTSQIDYPIQSIVFGEDLQMIFLAGEVCVDYALRIKSEFRREHLWVHGYANDFCAYIPSERLLREGGYGGGGEIPYFALPTTLETGLEAKIMESVARQIAPAFREPGKTQGIPPRSPAESLRLMSTHPELRIELVAAEPMIASPVALDFGADGRMWVAEMPDYGRGVAETFEGSGRVRWLVDDNQDGLPDRSGIFLDGLKFPTDVKAWRDGVLVCDAPDILFARDLNGDGVADERKTLVTGFATHNPHARVNSLRYSLDGWLHGSGGLFGGELRTEQGRSVAARNRDFRWQPDRGELQSATGQTQQGLARDDFENWFGCTNGALCLHYPLDERDLERRRDLQPPETILNIASAAHGQRLISPGDLVMFPLSGAPGVPTSACGLEIYRADRLGASYYGNAFVCEPVHQLVHRLVWHRDPQGQVVGDRAPTEIDREFLMSRDRWFRPVQARTGPDGALYVVDMYRFVIEHAQWIPEETRRQLDLFAGFDRGRIYRVVPRDQTAQPWPNLRNQSAREWIDLLASPNGALRDLAQQLLQWRDSPLAESEVNALRTLNERVPWPAARAQICAVLTQYGVCTPQDLLTAGQLDHRELRRSLAKLAGNLPSLRPEDRRALWKWARASEPEVLTQLIGSLGPSDPAGTLASLPETAWEEPTPTLRYAMLSLLNPDLAATRLTRGPTKMVARGDRDLIKGMVREVNRNEVTWRSTLAHWLATIDLQTVSAFEWELSADLLRADVAREAELPDELQQSAEFLVQGALALLTREVVDDEQRIGAMRCLGAAANRTALTKSLDRERLGTQLLALTRGQSSPAVQSAALQSLAALSEGEADHPSLVPRVWQAWDAASPRLRREILDVMLARPATSQVLLDALDHGTCRIADLEPAHRQRLLDSADPSIRKRAAERLGATSIPVSADVWKKWEGVLNLPGDVGAGRMVFAKHCGSCHVLDGTGHAVGPDLAALTNRSRRFLMEAILDPNREVDSRYVNYIAVTRDGLTVSGILAEENAARITLKDRDSRVNQVLRGDLEDLRSSNRSAMPEGLERDLSPQEFADLLEYVARDRAPRRVFPDNQPREMEVAEDHPTVLPAEAAEIYGVEIALESKPAFCNIGYWHGDQDYVVWRLRSNREQSVLVALDYSCDPGSAGNQFEVEIQGQRLGGLVEETGGWSDYREVVIGPLQVGQGEQTCIVRMAKRKPGAPALFDLKSVRLMPSQ